jgi:RND family efflux transporter MFP subunit
MYYNDVVKYGLPILILLSGIGLTYLMVTSYEEPDREEPEPPSSVVETQTLERKEHRLDVTGSGTVIPAKQVRVTPQVSGKVVSVSDDLVPGGIVEEGQQLLRIDPSDYRIRVDQAKQNLRQAQAQLAIERGQKQVAKQEWEFFKKSNDINASGKGSDLALRKPQLKIAKSRVETAKSNLEQARLNLRRTSLEAPFSAVVLQESTEVGQVAGPSAPVATLVGTDVFWVRTAVDTDRLDDLTFPKRSKSGEGSQATVRYDLGSETLEKEGRVVRLLGDLTEQGRMAKVLVRIPDPLNIEADDKDSVSAPNVPLLISSFVDVQFEGRRTEKLIEIPREAIQEGNEVYLMEDGKLDVREVNIIWRRPETVLVDSGVKEGDKVVTSPLANPIEGMALELASDKGDSE